MKGLIIIQLFLIIIESVTISSSEVNTEHCNKSHRPLIADKSLHISHLLLQSTNLGLTDLGRTPTPISHHPLNHSRTRRSLKKLKLKKLKFKKKWFHTKLAKIVISPIVPFVIGPIGTIGLGLLGFGAAVGTTAGAVAAGAVAGPGIAVTQLAGAIGGTGFAGALAGTGIGLIVPPILKTTAAITVANGVNNYNRNKLRQYNKEEMYRGGWRRPYHNENRNEGWNRPNDGWTGPNHGWGRQNSLYERHGWGGMLLKRLRDFNGPLIS